MFNDLKQTLCESRHSTEIAEVLTIAMLLYIL